MNRQPSLPTIVLIVPDPDRRLAIQRFLNSEGYHTQVAQGWQAGITLVKEMVPDLIFLDWNLPGIGGDVLAIRLQLMPELQNTAIVALGDELNRDRALVTGCSGFLPLSIDPAHLADQVPQFLQARQEPLDLDRRNQHLVALVNDLATRLEKQTLDLDETHRQLLEAKHTTDSFLIAAARELRTPLTLITGYSTLLQSSISLLDPQEVPLSLTEMIEGLVQGTKRLDAIVQELLRVSRVVTGDINLAIGPTRIRRVVSTALNELEPGERSTIQMGELGELPIIQADGTHIRLAFRNILNHFLCAVPPGGVIEIEGQHQQDIVIISVQGTGVAVEPGEEESLLDRLYTVPRDTVAQPSRRPEGDLGFGLAVAKGIIQAHQGRIWIESSGYGETAETTFYILLPIST